MKCEIKGMLTAVQYLNTKHTTTSCEQKIEKQCTGMFEKIITYMHMYTKACIHARQTRQVKHTVRVKDE